MNIIRKVLGGIILFFDALTRPRQIQRSPEAQQQLDEQTAKLQLFEFRTCPFCVKVRRNVHRLNLNIALRDAKNDPKYTQELVEGGGKRQVPCLRIQEGEKVRWMYESKAINAYLNECFEKAI